MSYTTRWVEIKGTGVVFGKFNGTTYETSTPTNELPFVINEFNPLTSFSNRDFTQNHIRFSIEKEVTGLENTAEIEIYNLSPDLVKKFAFIKSPFQSTVGAELVVNIGTVEGGIKQVFQGVIVRAYTLYEPPNSITRITIQNNYAVLQSRRINKQFSKGSLVSDYIVKAAKSVGANISVEQELFLRKQLGTRTLKRDLNLAGTSFRTFLNRIREEYEIQGISFYFDDSGLFFNPFEIRPFNIKRDYILDGSKSDIIGVPKFTETGVDYEVPLRNDFRLTRKIKVINSRTFDQFSSSAGGFTNADYSSSTIRRIHHFGDNREGDFKTLVESYFPALLDRKGTA